MEGWIKLHRQILESPVFAHQTALKIWIWCLCKANHADRSFPISTGRGETIVNITRGQFIFGRFKAENELGINGSTVYKWIHKFSDEMDMINIESNTHYSIITILNFNYFQDFQNDKVTTKEQPSNNQVTSKEQASNTYKNVNNVNNVKNDNVFDAEAIDLFGNKSDNWFSVKKIYIHERAAMVYEDGLNEYLDKYHSGLRIGKDFIVKMFWEQWSGKTFKSHDYVNTVAVNIKNKKEWIKS
jgi:hypothetical protein